MVGALWAWMAVGVWRRNQSVPVRTARIIKNILLPPSVVVSRLGELVHGQQTSTPGWGSFRLAPVGSAMALICLGTRLFFSFAT